jgi:hypothetical protein
MEFIDTKFVMVVVARQDGNERACIYQDPFHFCFPKPSKCLRPVLKSSGRFPAQPIRSAAEAISNAKVLDALTLQI